MSQQQKKRSTTTMIPYPYVWQEGHTPEQERDGAYWERNMLALYIALRFTDPLNPNGWYYAEPRWDGWARVISIDHGSLTFHVPDDFDLGKLPQIAPNWDGHTTEQKWHHVMLQCGVTMPTVQCMTCGRIIAKADASFSEWNGVTYDNPLDPDYAPLCQSCLAGNQMSTPTPEA